MTTLATVPIQVDDNGMATIEGTQIQVTDVVKLKLISGLSPEAIQAAVPGLTLGNVYAALAYYYAHQEILDTMMKRRQVEIDHAISQLKAQSTTVPGANWLSQVSGHWPGNETDEQIDQALEQMS